MKLIHLITGCTGKVLCCTMAIGILTGLNLNSALGAENSGISSNQNVQFWLAELEKRHTTPLPHIDAPPPRAKVSETVSSKANHKKGKKKAGPKKISVDFYKVDLHNVFRLLGQVSGKNIVVDEGVKGTLTLALKDVPWTFVLEVIKNLKGLESTERYGTIMIYPATKKLSWAEESDTNASGTLEMAEADTGELDFSGPIIPGQSKSITIDKVKRSKTPLKNIVKAEKLIKDAVRYEKAGQYEDAFTRLKKAVELWPDNLDLQKKIASMYLKKGNILDAFNHAKEAVKLDPDDPEAAVLMAVSLASLNRNREARTYFEKALNTGKMDRDGMWNYAVFLFSQGDYRSALRLITKMESRFPVDPDMIMMKAQCYEHLNKKGQAISEYRTILSAGKGVPPNMTEYAQLRLQKLLGTPSKTSN